jgi:hypothetical protein
MSIIISKDEFKIIKENQHKYIIQFHKPCEPLIKSITIPRIILGTTSTNQYQTLTFSATSVQSFPNYLSLQKKNTQSDFLFTSIATKILAHLASQLDVLICNYSKTFIGYHPENIIVIDDNKFIYLSNEYIHDIEEESGNITLTYPYSERDFYLSPELKNINQLPAQVHFKTAYYSLGLLLCELTNLNLNTLKRDNMSPLYYTINRCLQEEPKSRSILFI